MTDAAAHVGLIGWPVAHSVSPAMHNAAFKALGLDWQYDLLPIPSNQLIHEFGHLLDAGYRGFNVTVPHKRDLLATIGRIQPDESVLAIGAANTITVTGDGALLATNTDWQGFRDDLAANGVAVSGVPCLILGTGGSARAVVYALRQMGAASVTFASRHPADYSDAISYAEVGAQGFAPGLIVNCTPVGMHPHVAVSPWPADTPFPPDAILYDLVYNPTQTALMQQARAAGARTIGGLGMLVRQGALSFAQWTGIEPPLDVMEEAAITRLGS